MIILIFVNYEECLRIYGNDTKLNRFNQNPEINANSNSLSEESLSATYPEILKDDIKSKIVRIDDDLNEISLKRISQEIEEYSLKLNSSKSPLIQTPKNLDLSISQQIDAYITTKYYGRHSQTVLERWTAEFDINETQNQAKN